MKITLRTYLSALLLFGVAFLSSCSKDDDEPSNIVTDSGGIKVSLEWTVNGSTTPIADADLDLSVYKGTNEIAYSWTASSFEQVSLSTLADGDYTVNVIYDRVDKAGELTVKVIGISTNNSLSFRKTFAVADEDDDIDFLKITKSGSKFTVTKL